MFREFPGGPAVKNPSCNAADAGSIPGRGTTIPRHKEWPKNKQNKKEPRKIKSSKKKKWLREDDVEWLQILRLLNYIFSSKRHPEPLFSKQNELVFPCLGFGSRPVLTYQGTRQLVSLGHRQFPMPRGQRTGLFHTQLLLTMDPQPSTKTQDIKYLIQVTEFERRD